MQKFLKYSIILTLVSAALVLTGCTRDRPEVPTSTTATMAPVTLDGTPTVLAVGATATPAPVLGTPTPFQIPDATATPIGAAGGSGTSSEIKPTATPTPLTAATVAPTTSTGGERIHIVQPGENLFRISLKYDVSVSELAAYNGISDPTLIYIGQKLRIPGGGTSVSGGTTYVVQPGDTLYTIAVQFDTTVQALMALNNISDANTIYIGQKLTVR